VLGSLGVVSDAGIIDVNVWNIWLYIVVAIFIAVAAGLSGQLCLQRCSWSAVAARQQQLARVDSEQRGESHSYRLGLCRELCCKASQTLCSADELQTRACQALVCNCVVARIDLPQGGQFVPALWSQQVED